MMDYRCDRSGRSAWLVVASAILVLASSMPAPAWGQTCFIRTPADVTAAMGDRIPASWYGYPINDPSPFNYYGGANYREYYGYGRGYGIAGFPGPFPASWLSRITGPPARSIRRPASSWSVLAASPC